MAARADVRRSDALIPGRSDAVYSLGILCEIHWELDYVCLENVRSSPLMRFD